jgi:hypothetical protein
MMREKQMGRFEFTGRRATLVEDITLCNGLLPVLHLPAGTAGLLVAATNMPDGGRIEYWFEPKIYMTEQQRNYLEVVGCGVNRGNFTTI